MKKLVVYSLLISVLGLNFGCSSTTVITSSDHDARIFVDGNLMGKGSVTYSDTKIVGSTTMVMLKKEGCEPQTYSFSRSEEFDAGACAGGVFLLFPFLWIEKYRPQHNYEFDCQKVRASETEPAHNTRSAHNK